MYILDGKLILSDQLLVSPENRAFCYGDSLFETMLSRGSNILHLHRHWNRLCRGMLALGYEVSPRNWSEASLTEGVGRLQSKQGIAGSDNWFRIKLQVWRSEGGKYTAENNTFHYLLKIHPCKLQQPQEKSGGICESVRLNHSFWSCFKTGNSMPYILAGNERKKKGLEEIVLLDTKGNISEAGASNLFWVRGNEIFTPSLDAGCLGGVRREVLLELLPSLGWKVNIGLYPPSELLEADSAFLSNAMGVHHLSEIEGIRLKPWRELLSVWSKLMEL